MTRDIRHNAEDIRTTHKAYVIRHETKGRRHKAEDIRTRHKAYYIRHET